MSEIEIANEGIPSIRQDISSKSTNFCFEITFNKKTDIKLMNSSRLIIVDNTYNEVKNDITFDSKTLKAKFVSFRPYKPDIDYTIVLTNSSNVIIKKIISFQINGDNKITFKKIEEKANLNALKKTTVNRPVGDGSKYIYAGNANHIMGASIHEGKLYIFKDKLIFQKLSPVNGKDDLQISISDLKGIEWHGPLSAIALKDKNGGE